jgi:hypothetical protein
MPTFEHDGASIYYEESGAGFPILTFAPGGLTSTIYHNLYDPGFLYSVDRAFVSSCRTPCMVLAGNDEAHPYPVSEETAQLLPEVEFIKDWKTGAALAAAKIRIHDFLAKHTPRARG